MLIFLHDIFENVHYSEISIVEMKLLLCMLIHEIIQYAVNRHFTYPNYVYKFILILPYRAADCVDKWVTTYLDILFAPSSTSTMLGVMDPDCSKQTAITKSEYLMTTNTTLMKVWKTTGGNRTMVAAATIVSMAAADGERISIFPLVCPNKARCVSFSAPDI